MGAQTKVALCGFIGNTHDALIVFEACRRGLLPRAQGRLSEAERKAIKSGDIFVFNEDESQIKRWTDGKRWSPSRILNNFLIYRELRSEEEDLLAAAMESKPKVESEEVDELNAPTEAGITSQQQAEASSSTVPDSKLRNITGGMELLPNRKEGGLTKKTISVAGLHMISYYTAEDAIDGVLRQPTAIPELANIDISHPFLMAQFFRHPPQVTFDTDGIPRLSGLTDDEPMVRKPPSQQRRAKKEPSESSAPLSELGSLPSTESGQNIPFPSVIHDAPFASNLTRQRSTSMVYASPTPPVLSPNHPSYSPHTSILANMTVDRNPLLPPLRPHVSSRSSTSTSAASTSDASACSPRVRSTMNPPTNRHEPYRVPVPRQRYSIAEFSTPETHASMYSSSYPYTRHGSLPHAGMECYRPSLQAHSQHSTDYYSSHSSHPVNPYWSGEVPLPGPSTESQYLGYPSRGYSTGSWPAMYQSQPSPLHSPQSFYSAPSIQSGQLANGEPPEAHSSQNNLSLRGDYRQSDNFRQHLVQTPANSYGGHVVHANATEQTSQRPWYAPVIESQQTSQPDVQTPAFARVEMPPHMIAPQPIQHLSSFLPQTGYSPLLPSIAAYDTDAHAPQFTSEKSEVKLEEDFSPRRRFSGTSAQDGYVTVPPPPSYIHSGIPVAQSAKSAILEYSEQPDTDAKLHNRSSDYTPKAYSQGSLDPT